MIGDRWGGASSEGAAAWECKRVGVVVLATDRAIEPELWRIFGRTDADLFVSRVPSAEAYDEGSLAATGRHVAEAAGLILPGSRLDALAFGCTSAAVAHGEARVLAGRGGARPGVPCTTPITAARAAFRAFGARRVALLTPYTRPVHERVRRHLEANGLAVTGDLNLGCDTESAITAVSGDEIAEAVRALARRGPDAVFVSCTALRVVNRIAALERMAGLPVVTSNQALAWHCLRLARSRVRLRTAGRLLRLGGREALTEARGDAPAGPAGRSPSSAADA